MKNYLEKVLHILPIYLLAVFVSVVSLGFLRYFLDIKNILPLKRETWELFFPMIISVLSIAIIRKRFWVLKVENKKYDNFFYIFICGLLLLILLIISQTYLTEKFSKSQDVNSISKIDLDKNIENLHIKSFYVDKGYFNDKIEAKTTGRYGQQLEFTYYFVAAILNDSLEVPKDDLPKVWFSDNFYETISNSLSKAEKEKKFNEFLNSSHKKVENYNFYKTNYFNKIPISEKKDIYLNLISQITNNSQNQNLNILSPSKKINSDEGKSVLRWFFKILGIGLVVILFSFLFPKYQNPQSKSFKKEEDELMVFLKYLVPNKENLVTPIIIDINILVFILLCIEEVNPFYPRTMDLIKYGALERPISGEYWRFITSMFLHSGIMHLFQNMAILAISGFIAEKIFGKINFSILYILSGILAGITTFFWHHYYVGVGASGAIFGVIGAITSHSIFIEKGINKNNKGVLLIILGFLLLNLFFGLISNADNVVHVSGFLTGIVFGVLFSYRKK